MGDKSFLGWPVLRQLGGLGEREMFVVAALFVVWVVARPVRPPTPTEPDQMGPSVEPDRGPF